MSSVEYLAGKEDLCTLPLAAYSQEAIAFLDSLSDALMNLPEARAYPDLIAAAFWCRRRNLLKRKEHCPEVLSRLGRGLAFHIAPSNIPMNFAFSWFFSLLAGNANLVRLPSKRYAQAAMFCAAVGRLLPKYPEIEKRNAFVSYPAGDDATARFCVEADARLIWGGDGTIAAIRRYPVKPRCVDLCFADRYSICILNGQAVLRTDERQRKRLAEGFYNDTYLMDQNACSSPRLILWINDSPQARRLFWDSVAAYAVCRYEVQGMTAIEKYTQVCEDGIEGRTLQSVTRQNGNLLYREELSELFEAGKALPRGRGGFFYEYRLRSLEEMSSLVDERYQTIVNFGVPAEDIRQLVLRNHLRGIDRIVPVGSAMDIDVIWDGYDIVRMLSRVIDLQ